MKSIPGRRSRFAFAAFALSTLLILALPAESRAQTPPPPPADPEATVPASAQPTAQEPPAAELEEPAPPQTPAQNLQSEIYVLVAQARGILDEAAYHEPLSDEVQQLVSEVEVLLADCEEVREIFSVPELQALVQRLLDTPLRLHQLLAEEATIEAGPDDAEDGEVGADPPAPGSVPGAEADNGPGADRPSPPAGDRPPPPPPALREGAQAFFGGDYQRALEVLEQASFERPRAQAQVHLLRAAARYSLFLMSEGDDDGETTLDAVRTDLRDGLRLDADLRPDARLFSPRFVHFFGELRQR